MTQGLEEPASNNEPLAGGVARNLLSKQIADILRSDIVHGRLRAGVRLTQDDLCKRFGTSRIPVRDALVQLTQDGLLIEVSGQREVALLGREDLADSLELVALLHGWAARRVTEVASDEELDGLVELYERALAAPDDFETSQLLWKLITTINKLAGSPRLLAMFEFLQRTAPRAFPIVMPSTSDATKEIGTLIRSIRARDTDNVESIARSHARSSSLNLLRFLDNPE